MWLSIRGMPEHLILSDPPAPPAGPELLLVCVPADDLVFRYRVEAAVRRAGPAPHLSREGLVATLTRLQRRYADVTIESAVWLDTGSRRARQIWWNVYRDGVERPVH